MSELECQMGSIPGRGCAARRFTDALLQSLGGLQVTIRMSDPSTGDSGSQLGLEPPPAEDLQIFPSIITSLPSTDDGKRRIEVMLSATSLKPIARTHGIEDIATWLLTAQGVLHNDQLMRIDTVAVDHVFGSNCLYRITATE